LSSNGHELNRFGFARLEADGCPRRNVEALAVSPGSVEAKRRVRFDEVIMAPDLNWPIAKIRDRQGDRFAARIQFDIAVGDFVCAGLLFDGRRFEQGNVRHRQKASVNC
jgi:hypothetical protein